MKRRLLGFAAVVAAVVCLLTVPAFAADNFNANKLGVGYQGIFFGDMMSGLSGRYWIGPNIGVEGNLFYGNAKFKADGSDEVKAQMLMIDLKGMYAFLVRPNSKFYVGGQIAYAYYDGGTSDDGFAAGYFFAPGILAGAEWCIPQLPEVGFNFELGYKYVLDRNETPSGSKYDVDLHGMNLSLGVHYYF